MRDSAEESGVCRRVVISDSAVGRSDVRSSGV
jgi:hypothetical protein